MLRDKIKKNKQKGLKLTCVEVAPIWPSQFDKSKNNSDNRLKNIV
jgi:hypothetical protein